MTVWQTTFRDLEDSGLAWRAPVLNYEMFGSAHRGSVGWHIERCRVLYRTFHLKLLSFFREPHKNQIRINKKPWLKNKYAVSLGGGLLEQILAEEAARVYEGLNSMGLSITQSMRAVLDEYPAAAESVSSDFVDSAKELGSQTGYMVDLWNRVVGTDPRVLKHIGVVDIAAQSRRDAVVAFIAFFRMTGHLLAHEGMRYLAVHEYAGLLQAYAEEQ